MYPSFLTHLMGGRYHQKYTSFKWFRQNIAGSCVGYEIAQTINNWYSQSTNCLALFAVIEKDKRKQFSQNINGMSKQDIKRLNNQVKMRIVQLSFAIWYKRKPNNPVKEKMG